MFVNISKSNKCTYLSVFSVLKKVKTIYAQTFVLKCLFENILYSMLKNRNLKYAECRQYGDSPI